MCVCVCVCVCSSLIIRWLVARPQGKAGKYTEYSSATGITKDQGQSTLEWNLNSKDCPHPSLQTPIETEGYVKNKEDVLVVKQLTARIREFAAERQWNRFHLPRNLFLALQGELGELAELVQWKDDSQPAQLTLHEVDKLSQEIADVSIYLLRLADVCGIRLYD